jgi:type IV pilus assembly protein PilN
MIRINLLPHRALKRKALQQQFFIVAAMVAGLGGAIWLLVHTLYVDQIESQQGRNRYLEEQIVILDKQIEEIKKLREQTQQLLSRKKVVESLQGNRAEVVHLLDELVRQLPDGVYLKAIKQTGERVSVTGYAQSNARVSTLMRNLESSPWLEQATLVEIKTATQRNLRLSEFQLTVNLTRSKPDDGKKPAAPPAKTGAAPSGRSSTVAQAPSAPHNSASNPSAPAFGG